MSTDNIKLFQKQKERLNMNREEAIRKLQGAQSNYEKLFNSTDPRKEIKLKYEKNKVSIYENSLNLIEDQLRFLRPSYREDIEYRERQTKDFAEQVARVLPDDIPLRFHGCPIYAAEKIIASGEISSSVDRLGVPTSYDGAGQISVTIKDNLDITVQNYTNLSYDYNLPAGCIFVITPENLDDEEYGNHQMMNSVKFKNAPERLVAVISTPENIPHIQSWLQNNNISSSKAIEFDNFIQSIDKIIDSINISYRNISHSIRSDEIINKPKSSLDALISDASSRLNSKNTLNNENKSVIKTNKER